MAIATQVLKDQYAIYNGDSMEVMQKMPDGAVHLSVYSPPFGGLYEYSSNERDLSNTKDYAEFFDHYRFFVKELSRLTMPGRVTAVHCADVPSGNSGNDHLMDFSGDIIRLHQEQGWLYTARYAVWKEPLRVRNRTMAKNLAHKTVVTDASKCANAAADYLLVFRKRGENPVPVEHPTGFDTYAGARQIPDDLLPFRGWKGKQTENRYSHWIWRQYASAFWDDIRPERVLPFKQSRDEDDERHVHPLQLDIIERIVMLWSNPGEVVFTPFMGVGSEVFTAVECGRKGVGCELKPSYFKQAAKNMELVGSPEQPKLIEAVPVAEMLGHFN